MDTNKIVARAKSILLSPKTEWPVIAAESDTVAGIYTGYILIMAAIPAVIGFLRLSVVGTSIPFLGLYRTSMSLALSNAVTSYVLSLVGIYIVMLVVNALAPSFSAEKNQVQALKAVAYAYTAGWVASIVGLVPGLGIIATLAGLVYGIYLLRLGLPATMKCPDDKAIGYTAATIVIAIVVYIVIGLVIAGLGLSGMRYGGAGGGLGSIMHSGDSASGFANGSTGAALQNWAKGVEEAAKKADAAQKSGDASAQANAVGQMVGAALGGSAKVQSLSTDTIKQFVPDTLGGLPRTRISAERNGAFGMQVSKATASYSDGAQRNLDLEITDTGSMKGLVGFASGWVGVEQDKQTDTGFEKLYKSGSQLVHEQWDNRDHRGQFGVVVGDRFSVTVSGSGADISELKAALGSINLGGLEALKNSGVQTN